MKDRTGISIREDVEDVIQKVKKITGLAILCVFVLLLCMLFFAIFIVWSLADCTIRKIEADGCQEKDEKRDSL